MAQTKEAPMPEVDVAVIGGGIAGLVAAMRLKGRRCAVLEAADRPGGRIHSTSGARGPINLGAHMVPAAESLIGSMVADLGLAARPVPQHLFGLRYGGQLHLGTSDALLPFLLPLSLRERAALIRMGLSLRTGARRSLSATRHRVGETASDRVARALAFEDDRTLADYIGPLPPRLDGLLAALTERNGADPAVMTAGHGLRSFANVWARSAPGTNLIGGTSKLPLALADQLGAALCTMHRVSRIEAIPGRQGPVARITYSDGRSGRSGTLTARVCIIATPAPVAADLVADWPADTLSALRQIRYGPFLSLGLTLSEGEQLAWNSTYAIATPGLSFSVLFNHDAMRAIDDPAVRGHSIMLFRGASGAEREMQEADATIVERWLTDLERAFPGLRRRVTDARLMRWALGAPFAAPGRAAMQAALERTPPPFILAGDYMEAPNMEAAAQSGARAATLAEEWLDALAIGADGRTALINQRL